MPRYLPSRPTGTVAPEQANARKLISLCRSARSRATTDCAAPDRSERWQRGSIQPALITLGVSGLPSPEATESPIETTRKSAAETFWLVDPPPCLSVTSCCTWSRRSSSKLHPPTGAGWAAVPSSSHRRLPQPLPEPACRRTTVGATVAAAAVVATPALGPL